MAGWGGRGGADLTEALAATAACGHGDELQRRELGSALVLRGGAKGKGGWSEASRGAALAVAARALACKEHVLLVLWACTPSIRQNANASYRAWVGLKVSRIRINA